MKKQILFFGALFVWGTGFSQNVFPTAVNTAVGLGTTSPTTSFNTKLHIVNPLGSSGIRLSGLDGYIPTSFGNQRYLSINANGDLVAFNLQTLYTADGTLAGSSSNRIVTMNSNNMIFRPSTLGTDFFINGTTGNVGIGNSVPTARLDVKGVGKLSQGVMGTEMANNQVFGSFLDRNDKCVVLSAGKTIGSGPGYVNTRMFNFYDFPTSNYDAKETVFFGIEDRGNNGRYRFIAQRLGDTQMSMLNKSQQEIMKVYEDGSDNVYMHFPKTNSRVVIGDLGTYLPQYKFVVRGSSKLEGDVITDANIGIGTTTFIDGGDSYKLAVNGNIRAKRVKVYTSWADFVFEKDYALPTLIEVEQHIKENGHLKDIPSAKEVEQNGIELGEMNKKLLQKVEELTLYIIEMNKELQDVKSQLKK